jgi:hypothetical protein
LSPFVSDAVRDDEARIARGRPTFQITNRLKAISCKILDLRFQALPDEITACHSSLGAKFGEWIDVVKDAQHRRASEAHVLDNIKSTSPIMPAVE